jgi:4-amino-4-deoxy-L-arabinose transferase-like glycosyltransferase
VSIVLDRPPQRAEINKAKERCFLGRSADFWICAGLVAMILLVQGWNIANYPTVSDDEGTYLAQGWAVQHGIGMAPYTYWFDHPPFGWIQIAALSWIPSLLFPSHHLLVVAYARIIMLPVTAVSAILVYLLARRMTLPQWAAALSVAMFGLSPLSVTLQRQIFLDNFAVPWMLAAFVLAYSPRRHLWHHVASGLAAALSVLSKETMILAVPALIVALWQNVHRRTRRYSLVGFAGALVLVGIQYPLYAALKGELFDGKGHVSLIGGIKYQLSRPGSGSIFALNSNSSTIFHSWLFYDSVLIVAGVIATLLALIFRHLRPMALAATLLTLVAMRPSGYLPAMYVIQVLPFFPLVIAGMADQLVNFLLKFRARPVFWQQAARMALVGLIAFAAAFYVVPKWYRGDHTADTADTNAGYQAAATWIAVHIPHPGNKRIAVDDGLWLNMANDGFKPSHRDIYFFKINNDPAVNKALRGSWRSINYIVSTPYLRQNATLLPILEAALAHSRALWSYGTGPDQIQILKVVGSVG